MTKDQCGRQTGKEGETGRERERECESEKERVSEREEERMRKRERKKLNNATCITYYINCCFMN